MKEYPNVVFMVADTLRKDALSVYGSRYSTPSIDSFAGDAVIFKNAVAPAPWTYPSHVSSVTGSYPRDHGGHEYYDAKGKINVSRKFDGETIVERVRKRGYSTVGFTTNPQIGPGTGFERGFEYFEYVSNNYSKPEEANFVKENFLDENWNLDRKKALGNFRLLPRAYRIWRDTERRRRYNRFPIFKGGNIVPDKIYDSHRSEPFFLFINFVEVHEPYFKERKIFPHNGKFKQIAETDGERARYKGIMDRMKEKYFLTLGALDQNIGGVLRNLKREGLYEDSLIVLTSDHGQAFMEKNYFGHGVFLYDEIIQIPLLVKFPQGRKMDVREGYQSLTSMPALINDAIEGSLTDITREAAFSQSFGFYTPMAGGLDERLKDRYGNPRIAVYKDGYKLVLNSHNGDIEEYSFKGKPLPPRENIEAVRDLTTEIVEFPSMKT